MITQDFGMHKMYKHILNSNYKINLAIAKKYI